ncbi:MAG: hypothetical protein WBQ11_08635, partial [Isosphaeraceae bacterium]
RAQRRLVPAAKVRTVTDCRPTHCRRCGQALAGDDPAPLVHQVAELRKIEPRPPVNRSPARNSDQDRARRLTSGGALVRAQPDP